MIKCQMPVKNDNDKKEATIRKWSDSKKYK